MKYFFLFLLIGKIASQDAYENLIYEKVTEEYCKDVISNMISIIKDGYVFLDFLKSPIQPEGYDDYFTKVDLIQEINDINTKNRTFYDFYREIQHILDKTRDGHFNIYALKTPNNFDFISYFFCIPFKYFIKEIFEKDILKETYLSIEPIDSCKEYFTKDILNKINEFSGKKIISINGLAPFDYLEEMGKKGMVVHSPQARYILLSRYISKFPLYKYPFKKEELSLSIKFDDIKDELELEYKFEENKYFNSEFKEYYISEQEKYFKYGIPFSSLEEIEVKYNIKKRLINKNIKKDTNSIWDLESNDRKIKCKVDKDNQINVIYQNSFFAYDFDNYETIMYNCFEKFYSNDYKIIIIEDQNTGGYSELCIPFTQYTRPKISKPTYGSSRSTDLINKYFFINDETVNPFTCKTYTEKDKILDGYKDIYSEKIIHKRTKYFEGLNIFEKKIMEIKRRAYLKTGKTKKPTETLVFTDGFSFSCGSLFIKELQIHGAAIMVGYNIRPDLVETKIDASQSNSPIESFSSSESFKNLVKLGYYPKLTFTEHFDCNDDSVNPKIPMKFKIYPVDAISNIYKQYDDKIYYRFIKEAKIIFEKYNNLNNGECNPDNKYLYYDSSECDSLLKIEKAHGGFLCGSDGKWNKTKCIASYCDPGYILNDERTECLIDHCDDLILNEISIKEEKDIFFKIEPKNIYIFKIENQNYKYSFYSDLEKLFYIYNERHILEAVENGININYNQKIYVNYFTNITNTIEIKVKVEKSNDEKGLSKGILSLILSISIVLLVIIFFIFFRAISKKQKLSNSDIEEISQYLNKI